MGKVVYRIDSLDKHQLKDSALKLACVCGSSYFDIYIYSDKVQDNYFAQSEQFESKYPLFHEPLAFLKKTFRESPILFRQFAEVRLALDGVPFSVVPANQAEARSSKELSAEYFAVSTNDSVGHDIVNAAGLHVIYAIPKVFMEELKLYFGNVNVIHKLSALMDFVAHEMTSANCVVVHANAQITTIVIKKDGKVLTGNQYPLHGEHDTLYYLTALLQHYDIDTAEFEVNVADENGGKLLRDQLMTKFNWQDVGGHSQSEERLFQLKRVALCAL